MALRDEKLGRDEDRLLHRRGAFHPVAPVTKCGRRLWHTLSHTKFARLRWPETFCGGCFSPDELKREGLV